MGNVHLDMDGFTRIGKEQCIFKIKVLKELKLLAKGSQCSRYGQFDVTSPRVNDGTLNLMVINIGVGPFIQVYIPDNIVVLSLGYKPG